MSTGKSNCFREAGDIFHALTLSTTGEGACFARCRRVASLVVGDVILPAAEEESGSHLNDSARTAAWMTFSARALGVVISASPVGFPGRYPSAHLPWKVLPVENLGQAHRQCTRRCLCRCSQLPEQCPSSIAVRRAALA